MQGGSSVHVSCKSARPLRLSYEALSARMVGTIGRPGLSFMCRRWFSLYDIDTPGLRCQHFATGGASARAHPGQRGRTTSAADNRVRDWSVLVSLTSSSNQIVVPSIVTLSVRLCTVASAKVHSLWRQRPPPLISFFHTRCFRIRPLSALTAVNVNRQQRS